MRTQDGCVYYYNSSTGVSSWGHPCSSSEKKSHVDASRRRGGSVSSMWESLLSLNSNSNNNKGGQQLEEHQHCNEIRQFSNVYWKGVREHAKNLGMDPNVDDALLWIAEKSLLAPLPRDWTQMQTHDGNVYYHNTATGSSIWCHPCDKIYRQKYLDEKKAMFERRRDVGGGTGSSAVQHSFVPGHFSDQDGACSDNDLDYLLDSLEKCLMKLQCKSDLEKKVRKFEVSFDQIKTKLGVESNSITGVDEVSTELDKNSVSKDFEDNERYENESKECTDLLTAMRIENQDAKGLRQERISRARAKELARDYEEGRVCEIEEGPVSVCNNTLVPPTEVTDSDPKSLRQERVSQARAKKMAKEFEEGRAFEIGDHLVRDAVRKKTRSAKELRKEKIRIARAKKLAKDLARDLEEARMRGHVDLLVPIFDNVSPKGVVEQNEIQMEQEKLAHVRSQNIEMDVSRNNEKARARNLSSIPLKRYEYDTQVTNENCNSNERMNPFDFSEHKSAEEELFDEDFFGKRNSLATLSNPQQEYYSRATLIALARELDSKGRQELNKAGMRLNDTHVTAQEAPAHWVSHQEKENQEQLQMLNKALW